MSKVFYLCIIEGN